MKRVNLLGICCNWSPYACYTAAGMARMKMPPNFRLLRVMCIGRINQALILRAFEYGADGVIVLECKDEDCRYGPGPDVGHVNVYSAVPLKRWFDSLAKYIVKVHINDNDAQNDLHLAFGGGSVDLEGAYHLLNLKRMSPLMTLEMTPEQLPATLKYIEERNLNLTSA